VLCPPDSRVYGYSDEGYLIGNGATVILVSPEGDELRQFGRNFHALASDGTVILRDRAGAFERTTFGLETVEPFYAPTQDQVLVQIRWLPSHDFYAAAAKTIVDGLPNTMIRTIDTGGRIIDEIELPFAYNRLIDYGDRLVIAGVEDETGTGRRHSVAVLDVDPLRVTRDFGFDNWLVPVAIAPGR